jgi:hypothetical protein
LQIIKIVLASLLFPLAHFRALLNAITLPMLMLIGSWSLGVALVGQHPVLLALIYLVQLYGAAMLLTHCVLLITRSHTPPFLAAQPIYLRSGLLMLGFTLLSHILSLLLFTLGLNLLRFSSPQVAGQFQEIIQGVVSVLLFGTYFIVPHYIHSGKMALALVLTTYRKRCMQFIAIALLIELCRYLFAAAIPETSGLEMALLLTIGSLLAKVLEYLLIAFCYLGFFLEQGSETSDNEPSDQ